MRVLKRRKQKSAQQEMNCRALKHKKNKGVRWRAKNKDEG